MPRKRIMTQVIIGMLIITLLPFAELTGYAIRMAHADATGSPYYDAIKQEILENRALYEFEMTSTGYYLTAGLFYNTGEVEIESFSFEQAEGSDPEKYIFDNELEPGVYTLTLETWDSNTDTKVYEDTYIISMPEKGEFTVYLFGPELVLEDLEFYNHTTGLNVQTDFEPGNGYVKYTAEVYADGCFTLDDGGEVYAFSNIGPICAESGWEHVVHANKTGYVVDVLDYEVTVENGRISGYFLFANPDSLTNFQLNVINEENENRACAPIAPSEYEKAEFECEYHDGDALLRIDYVLGLNEYDPTNAVFRLDDPDLPVLIGFGDANTDVGFVEPTIQFAGPGDVSDIALYKIVPPYSKKEDELPGIVKYKPAADAGPHTVTFDEFEAYVGDHFSIRIIDSQGREFVKALNVPVIDDMASALLNDDGLIYYEQIGCGGIIPMSWKCYTIEAVDPFPELIDPWFEDGTIGWTSPSAEDTVFPAYDIYFADDEGETFAAVARVNVAPDHQGEIEYTLSDIPGEARYAAVVPLAVYTDIEGEEWVYRPIEPFLIELSEAQQPALLEVVETGSMFFGNDFTLYYRIENPNNVNYTELVTLYRHVNGSWVPALNWEFTWLFGGLHVTAGNLAIGSYRLVIEFKVGSDVAAELVRDFDIVDSLRLNQLKVNGIAASRDEHDAYHYIVRVDWDAEEALVTGMSPDGVVRIGESTVGANIPYSVALDGVETDVTLVVRHPTDEELYSEYRLTIIRTKPEITLTYLSFSADFVHLEWESELCPASSIRRNSSYSE